MSVVKPGITDMPIGVFEEIVKEVVKSQRLGLRDVCQSFRRAVDRIPPKFNKIHLFPKFGLGMIIDRSEYYYWQRTTSTGKIVGGRDWRNPYALYIRSDQDLRGSSFIDMALENFMSFVTHPSLKLNTFEYSATKRINGRFYDIPLAFTTQLGKKMKDRDLFICADKCIMTLNGKEEEIELAKTVRTKDMSMQIKQITGKLLEKLLKAALENPSLDKMCITWRRKRSYAASKASIVRVGGVLRSEDFRINFLGNAILTSEFHVTKLGRLIEIKADEQSISIQAAGTS